MSKAKKRAKKIIKKDGFEVKKFIMKHKYPIGIIATVSFLLLTTFGIYSVSYANKSYRNVYIGDHKLGGQNEAEIRDYLNRESQDILSEPFVLKYQPDEKGAKEYIIESKDIATFFDIPKTTGVILGVGRDKSALPNLWMQLKTFFGKVKVEAVFSINQEALKKAVSDIAGEVDQPEKDYLLEYSGKGDFVLIEDREEGERIDQLMLIESVKNQLKLLRKSEIEFKTEKFQPKITYDNAQNSLKKANKILAEGNLNLIFKDQVFALDDDAIAGFIGSRPKGDDLEIYIQKERLTKQVETIAKAIDVEPQDAELKFSGSKVTVFKNSVEGKKLDQDQTKIDVENALLSRIIEGVTQTDKYKVILKVKLTSPEVNSSNIESYGLTELIASGTTDFKGSPQNRRHNISVGAETISGTLLKPGEEFSTLSRLGTINADAGYLEELVIKENRTIPEFGGGLCQVSTTLFRAALNAGTKITVRANHKYRVSYYEPPVGMDATIYDPAPDFKFVNNYNSYILIQATISGTKLTFEFYGTRDDRSIEISQPEVYDYVNPGPAIEIQTDTLPAGERNRIERGHQGASAKFHYKVSRGGEILQERDFISKYVPWQERWMVGKVPDQPIADRDGDGIADDQDPCPDDGENDKDGDGVCGN